MTYLDERGKEELEIVAGAVDPRALHALTGAQLSAMYSLPKLLWLRRNRPDVVSRVRKLMLFSDYVGYRLSGARAIDGSLASRTLLLDVRTLDWSDEILGRFGIPRGLLSPVCRAGAPVGCIRKEAARELGLPASLKLLAGCHDQCAAALGAGVFEKNAVMAGEGSSESLIVLTGREEIDASIGQLVDRSLSFEPFVLPGLYAVTLGQPTYGTCSNGLRRISETARRPLNSTKPARRTPGRHFSCRTWPSTRWTGTRARRARSWGLRSGPRKRRCTARCTKAFASKRASTATCSRF